MRKHVKILVSAIAVLCMIVCAAIPAFAAEAETVKVTVAIPDDTAAWTGDDDSVKSVDLGDGKSFSYNHVSGKDNLQVKEGIWQVSVGQAPTFKFSVPAAGTYTLTIGYSSKTGADQERAATIKVNDAEPVKITNVDQTSDNWNVRRELTVDVTLKEGENTIVFGQNTVVAEGKVAKDINIIDISFEYTVAASDDNQGDNNQGDNNQGDNNQGDNNQGDNNQGDNNQGDNNTEDKPGDGEAGKTGFVTVALAVVALGSGAYVVSKRRH